MRYATTIRDDVARRTAEGRTNMGIIRCLKRYLARQLYPPIRVVLQQPAKSAAA